MLTMPPLGNRIKLHYKQHGTIVREQLTEKKWCYMQQSVISYRRYKHTTSVVVFIVLLFISNRYFLGIEATKVSKINK